MGEASLREVCSREGRARREVGITGIGDADLVERALAGDVRAEDVLFRRHSRAVAGLAARLLGNRSDADDVVHDAFLSAFQELERLKSHQTFKAWVTQIAVNRVRVLLRRRSLERRLGLFQRDEDATLESLASGDVSAETRAELSRLDGLLRRLPARQRILWMLRMVEGYTFDEAAELSGCSTATAKRQFARAHRFIKAQIKIGGMGDG